MPIETIISNPIYLAGVVAGVAGFAGIQIYKQFTKDESETIDANGMKQYFSSIFTGAVESQGAKVGSNVFINGTSNTPRLIGYATKAKDLNVQVKHYKKDEDSQDKFKDKKSKGTVYEIIEGDSDLNLLPKKVLYKLGYKGFCETYDIPKKYITATDDSIQLDTKAHFVKINGVKRDLSIEGMGRGQETAFSTFHENYIDTAGKIPQQYAVLNNRLSGQLKVEDVKSENILKYKNQEDRQEKDID